eukprot:Nk52_evm4s309 gene=Nk52_evmTU4s309
MSGAPRIRWLKFAAFATLFTVVGYKGTMSLMPSEEEFLQSLPPDVRRDAIAKRQQRKNEQSMLLERIQAGAQTSRPAWQVPGIDYKVNEDGTTEDLNRRRR